MLIQNITLTTKNKKTTLSADITFHDKKTERVYLSTPSRYQTYITPDATPFLAAFLLPAMKKAENIHIEGSISKKFYQSTKSSMDTVINWNLGLKKITITATKITKDQTTPQHSATFFSAGVDSFYTYLKHQKQISHLILIHGFDIELRNKLLYRKTLTNIQTIAKKTKTKLITIETNMTPLIESKLLWDYAHGGALAAVALMFRNQLKHVYFSSAVRHDQLFPYGTHPDLDKHWSTETQTIHHDGTEYTRFEKIQHTLAKSPLALQHLRVCNQNIKGNYNCSQCFKCLVTMIQLKAAGILEKTPTFSTSLNLNKVRNLRFDYKLKYNLLVEICLPHLDEPLRNAILESLKKSKKNSLKQHLIKIIARLDQTYLDRRIYQAIFKLNQSHDRNTLFKFLVKKGIIK